MNYLVVVAHPDDEVIGAGASIFNLSQNNNVDVCIMSSKAAARTLKPSDEQLKNDSLNSAAILGIRNIYDGQFPNIQMNTVPHLELVQFIETAILKSNAEIIITHHPSDTNNDHLHTSTACQAAVRLFQRRPMVTPIKEVWYMEVLSSTEWSINTSMNRFSPNMFVEVGEDGIEAKIKALSAYGGVMREYPHPRSEQAIKGLSAYRGAQANYNYAEAFECVFRRLDL